MNRKLHNSLMALSTTGLLLVVGLMAATPAVGPAAMTTTDASPTDVAPAVVMPHTDAIRTDTIDSELDARIEAAIDARTKAFEAELGNADDAHQAIATTVAFVAETATEAALIAALAELQAKEPAAAAEAPARQTPRKRRSARSSMALPYFSFARGLRGGNGD
jgi:hypothetical protein